jgi:hypothetical protein
VRLELEKELLSMMAPTRVRICAHVVHVHEEACGIEDTSVPS